eukprot:TRINITY_DN14656_c0_g1_i1.p1 TRINITY_DN14656_c0_g1~~TRINITY_DN14656_c0_g1_i1.p1  ORF type:complete len:589 (+),score=101.78 TRINITY_DN14656_c0_g1_i1:111-1877(+)
MAAATASPPPPAASSSPPPTAGAPVYVRGLGPGRVVRATSNEQMVEVSRQQCGGRTEMHDVGDVIQAASRRLDYLRPSAEDPARRSSVSSATFSLLSTMMGGGVLSLPFAFSVTGVLGSVVLTVLSAFASGFSIDLLIGASRARGADSYELVAKEAFGKQGRVLTTGLIVGLIWLCQIAYLVLLADLMVPVIAASAVPVNMTTDGIRSMVICGAVLLVSPLCFKTSLHALRFMSVIAFTALCIVVLALGHHAFEAFHTEHDAHVMWQGSQHPVLVPAESLSWGPSSLNDVLYAFPIFGLSFLCHFNVLPMHAEIVRPTRQRTKMVVNAAMAVCTVLYIIAGLCGYVFAGRYTCGNILLNFGADDLLVNIARVALSCTLVGTFPLFILPCRSNLHQLVHMCSRQPESPLLQGQDGGGEQNKQTVSTLASATDVVEAGQANGIGGSDPPASNTNVAGQMIHVYDRTGESPVYVGQFLPKDEAGRAMTWSNTSFVVETLALLSTSTACACLLQSVLVVWTIAGATVSFTIAFTLPTAMWLRIHSAEATKLKVTVAKMLLALSVLASVVCTFTVVVNLSHPVCPAPTAVATM